MKVAVVGSRTLSIDNLQNYLPESTTEIISGGAKGIDTCAKKYCDKNNIPIKVILPEYDRYSRAAPIIRNKQIISEADYVLIFWNGTSNGTKFVINECKKLKKPHKIHIIK